MTIEWLGYRLEPSVGMLAVAVLVFAIVVTLLYRVVRAVLGTPRRIGRAMAASRRKRGYKALSQGMVAVAAGLIGAIIAYGVLVLAKIYIFDSALAPLTQVITDVPWSHVNLMLPILAGAAAVTSSITGWIALRFYIKV